MKIQIHEILGFSNFYQTLGSSKLPIKTAYKLSRLDAAIDKEVEFYRTNFRRILSECCQKDENGNFIPTNDGQGYKLLEGKEIECNKQLEELYLLEVELPDITFNIEEFDGVELSIKEMEGIMPFIAE